MQVKGKRELERIFTILGRADVAASSDFAILNERNSTMLAAYRSREWQRALEMILLCRELRKSFKLDDYYDLYIQRIRHLIDAPASSN
jgi:adenylate cyclase